MLERRFEFLDVFDVIDSDDGFVAYEFLRLFDKAFDLPVRVGDGYAETARVLDLIGIQDIFGGVCEALDVGVEECIAQDDEQWFVVVYVGEGEADGLPQTLGIALEYGAGVAPFGLRLEVLVHFLGLVAGDEDGF